ncbi:unnamed protein product [Caenorhabditis bovis]|uniref:TLC domain-containing protein n=1 Tax=Caenorhabditis bovis TaxID=2654633 RepID=A0A8S1F680_9PELO|nr:unnamed protein product [Caenorhabditis bovis]
MSIRLTGGIIRELRIHLCQTSPASAGVRAFVENEYVSLKKANPKFPILIREASGIVPRVFARYENGIERVASLENLSKEKVAVSFIFFRVLQFAVRWYLFGKFTWHTSFNYFGLRRNNAEAANRRQLEDSRDLTVIPPNKKWRISNEGLSLIHSVVSGLWAGYALLYYKDLMTDLIHYRCEVAINLILMSTGYLLHDLIDLLVNEQSARIIELLFHHVVVLTAFAVTMFTGKFLGVVVFGLLMELNSIFLHSRSLLNLYGVDKKSPSFRMIALLNMITLFFFRLCVSAYLLYFAATTVTIIPWWQVLINSVVILSLASTNSVLTYRLLAADGLLGTSRARKSPAPTGDTNIEDIESATQRVLSDEEHHEVAVQAGNQTVPLVEDSTQT